MKKIKPKVLCLVTTLRGGSKLFHSLLDGHPEIICFPRTLQLSTFLERMKGQSISSRDIATQFIGYYPRFFDGEVWDIYNKLDKCNRLGDGTKTFKVNKVQFINEFCRCHDDRNLNYGKLLVSLHHAYHLAKGKEVPDSPVIMYHIHDIGNINEIGECIDYFGLDFVKILFTTRNPIDGLNSVYKVYLYQHNLTSLFGYQKEFLYFTSVITKKFPGIELKIVLLEIIRSYRYEVMLNFAKWLGVSWSESLVISTIQDLKWRGNAETDKGDMMVPFEWYRPVGWFEKNDAIVFSFLASNRMRLFGEDVTEPHLNPFSFIVRMVAPTSQELKTFIKLLSVSYWYDAYKAIIKDINDTDMYLDGKIKGRFTKNEYLFQNIRSGTVLNVVYGYLKRVRLYFRCRSGKYFEGEILDLLFDPFKDTKN